MSSRISDDDDVVFHVLFPLAFLLLLIPGNLLLKAFPFSFFCILFPLFVFIVILISTFETVFSLFESQ